jgi:hypothetical protein
MLGDYLTTSGRDTCTDLDMLTAQGMEIRPAPHA